MVIRLKEEYSPQARISQAFEFAGLPPPTLPEPDTVRFESPEIELLARGFTQIPNIVLRDTRLSGNEVRLYAVLLSYAWHKGSCFPGQERLASNMHVDPATITKLMKTLVRYKLIRVKRRGLGKSNLYFVRRLTDAYCQSMVDKGAGG